jgi:hypothetical protein
LEVLIVEWGFMNNEIVVIDSAIGIIIEFRWIDKGVYQIYIPSLEISSYGNTIEEAQAMMNFSLEEFVSDLCLLGRSI